MPTSSRAVASGPSSCEPSPCRQPGISRRMTCSPPRRCGTGSPRVGGRSGRSTAGSGTTSERAVSSTGDAVPPAAGPPTETGLAGAVAHWNIAGWAMHRGDTAIATTLANWVRSRTELPLSLTVNEVCSAQFDVLREALAGSGYEAAAAWSIPDFDEPGCASYGNAVFWRGGNGGVESLTYPDDAQVDGAATREKRTLVRAVSATLPFAVATTHPAPHAEV